MMDFLTSHNILVLLNLVTFLFYLAILFFFFRIREKLENFLVSFIFITLGLIVLMVVGILDLLVSLQLMERVGFLQESLMAFFALCFLIAVIRIERVVEEVFYKSYRGGRHKKK